MRPFAPKLDGSPAAVCSNFWMNRLSRQWRNSSTHGHPKRQDSLQVSIRIFEQVYEYLDKPFTGCFAHVQ